MNIAVLSDTHGLLRPEVRAVIAGCGAVIHAGDIHTQKVLDEIAEVKKAEAPFYVVRGNADREWAARLPLCERFSLAGVPFLLVHNKKDVPEDLGDCQIVICGHSHQYAEERKDGRLWLNPGSCGKRRFHQDITMAVLHLGSPEPDAWRVERIDIPHGTAGNEAAKMPSGDMLQTVEKILKKLEKGQTIPAAARELKLNPEFVEDVYRMKVNHPGISAREILDKIEIKETGR